MKNPVITVLLLLIAHYIFAQGSADQWKYSPSNPTGIRYADFSPKDYRPASQEKKKVEEYTPDKINRGVYQKKKGKLWGYMGTAGKWLIEPQWEWVGPLPDAHRATYVYPKWVLGAENKGRVIDRSGNYISGEYVLNYEGTANDYLFGYGNHNRKFIYNLITEDSILLPEGLSLGQTNIGDFDTEKPCHYYHFVYNDSLNKIAAIIDFSDLKIIADHLEQYDYIAGSLGQKYLPNGSYDTNCIGDNRFSVSKNKKWGCININGAVVIPIEYDKGVYFEKGIASVEKDGVKFKIDVNGKKVD